jgi:hypothetical protein
VTHILAGRLAFDLSSFPSAFSRAFATSGKWN